MAYETGTASSQEDLMGKLHTFAVAQGWTSNVNSTTDDWMAVNNGSVFVQFRWDNATGIAVFQSLAWTGTGTAPGNQSGDSGVGLVDASTPYNSTVSSERRIVMGNSAVTAYHFFTDGTTQYIHCVVEVSAGIFVNFGFGTIDKIGSWTGGEYAFGHRWAASGSAASDNPIAEGASASNSGHNVLFDWLGGGSTSADANETGCTMHVEGVTGQPSGSKWGMFLSQGSTLGNDRAGNARFRLRGGVRGGLLLQALGIMPANLLNGAVPLIPISVWFHDESVSPTSIMLLGSAPDVCSIQMRNINPGQEFTVGADTWKVFPLRRKQYLLGDTPESWNAGLAFKKVA